MAPGGRPDGRPAVAKISRLQDLLVMGAKCTVVTAFATRSALAGASLSVRLQAQFIRPHDKGLHAATSIRRHVLGLRRRSDRHQSGNRHPERGERAPMNVDDISGKLEIPTQSLVIAQSPPAGLIQNGSPGRSGVPNRSPARKPPMRASGSISSSLREAATAELALERGTVGRTSCI